MLQIGRYSYRGTGAVMVAGPLGVALVPPEWAKGAREALIGRAEIVAWLTQVSQAGADAAVLDLAGPQAHLSLLGRAWVRAGRGPRRRRPPGTPVSARPRSPRAR